MSKTIGLIAEYNPLHDGHRWQLKYAREVLNASAIVVILSGDFTQRGIPACIDKYSRAEYAIEAGADLVIELPVVAATAGAETFARCGVAILNSLGFIDSLIFGAETPDISLFEKISELLAKDGESFKTNLKKAVSSGINFAKARALALERVGGDTKIGEFLSLPNNALGLEYVRSLKCLKSRIEYIPIQRQPDFKSSTEIRKVLDESEYILTKDFSLLINEALVRNDSFCMFYEGNEDLSNRILKTRDQFINVEEYCLNVLKSKNYTYARLMRVLFHILLDIKYSDTEGLKALEYAPYAHILGVKRGREDLLSLAQKEATIPVFTSHKEAEKLLLEGSNILLEKLYQRDLFASDLYRAIKSHKTGKPSLNIRRERLRVS